MTDALARPSVCGASCVADSFITARTDHAKVTRSRNLSLAVSGNGVAFRCRVTLQPAAGEGTKVFPPTYAGAVYATEKRRLPATRTPSSACCWTASRARRTGWRRPSSRRSMPGGSRCRSSRWISRPISRASPEGGHATARPGRQGQLAAGAAPDRRRDPPRQPARRRPVPESEIGKRIGMVSARDATALFELCPTALVFGMWDSTGPKGGLGAQVRAGDGRRDRGHQRGVRREDQQPDRPPGNPAESRARLCEPTEIGWTLEESLAKNGENKPVMLGKDGGRPRPTMATSRPRLSERDKETKDYLAGGVTISTPSRPWFFRSPPCAGCGSR